ncbi:MAG: hypothetical protein JSV92_00215 [archaeon]|nr:MAG: hypothetical protein JSV92_00215 [archaeon]
MKGISPFVATIILIAFVISMLAIISPLILDFAGSKKEEVEEKGETSVECGTGVLHIDSVALNGYVNVTVENLGMTDLSDLKIVAYNQSGAYTYDATPSSLSVGSKTTISSQPPSGTVTKIKVTTHCPTVYDEYEVS